MDLGLENKVAIVTGASRGIGKAIALELARERANIVVAGIDQYYNYRDVEWRGKDLGVGELEEVAREIIALGRKSLVIRADLSKPDEVENLVQKTKDTFGGIDILVQNVGVAIVKAFDELLEEEWDFQQEVNLKSAWLGAKSVAPIMREMGSGKIINIGSISGKTAVHGSASYSASKAGLIGLTQAMASELGPLNIQVNCVCPGFTMETDLADAQVREVARFQGVSYDALKNAILASTATKRWTRGVDVACFVCFLASDKSNQITGQAINVCGGLEKH